ncbi:MAG: bifunctional nuclease family protein [Flavobacteriaceae bacterium]|nr:bifunctional nuclease family protein [Flavobacteriaceae bacterium]
MSLIQLQIKGISYSQTRSGAYALVLNEVKGKRTLPIVIGPFEAQSIAIALEENMKPPRPLTHDLFKSFADIYHFTVKQVIIHKLIDGVFYSSLVVEKDKVEDIVDSRTSDAIAIAVRFNAPIFTYENILDKAGFEMQGDELLPEEESMDEEEVDFVEKLFSELEKSTQTPDQIPMEDLQKQLDEAIQNEDYELAARLRDEISKREKLE